MTEYNLADTQGVVKDTDVNHLLDTISLTFLCEKTFLPHDDLKAKDERRDQHSVEFVPTHNVIMWGSPSPATSDLCQTRQ